MKNKLMTLIACTLLAPLPGWASDVISGEIMQGWVRPDGSRVAAIRMTIAPGWKTYWRAPGDMGIPPSFDWSGSENLNAVAVEWPAPTVFREKNLTTIGYRDQLVLPIVIGVAREGAPVTLDTTIDLGVCSDICVPAKMHLNGVLDTTSTRADPAIAAALAQRPFSAREAGVSKATCALSMKDDLLELTATLTMPHAGGQELTVIEAGQPDIWVSEADTTRSGNTLRAKVDVAAADGGLVALNRSQIRITVLGDRHAVDVVGCTPG